MKVEIELNDLEFLKAEKTKLEKENKELNEQIKSYSSEQIKDSIKQSAYALFEKYLIYSFKELGFDTHNPLVMGNLEHWVGQDWYEKDEVFVELGATITNNIRIAFMRLGIKTKE